MTSETSKEKGVEGKFAKATFLQPPFFLQKRLYQSWKFLKVEKRINVL